MTSNGVAVVTCVTDDHDHIGDHKYMDGVDYIFFTDGMSMPLEDRWTSILLDPEVVPTDLDPRRRSKYPKIYPWFSPLLKSYEYVIWIDGSMQILDKFFPMKIIDHMSDKGWIISPHFDGRDCAYGEATIRPPKYASEPLDEQVAHYRREGFPEHYGLYECGVQARKMNAPEIEDLGRMWLEENLAWSYQDQVSLPYVLWKAEFQPDVLAKSWRDYGWLHVNAHRSER